MFYLFQSRNRAAVSMFIHDAGIERDNAIPVRIAPKPYTAIDNVFNITGTRFHRIKRRNRDLFDGISGYMTASGDRARLLIGPFRGPSDAEIFAENLKASGVNAFKWSNSPSDRIVPVAVE